jgi:hypothetical protein
MLPHHHVIHNDVILHTFENDEYLMRHNGECTTIHRYVAIHKKILVLISATGEQYKGKRPK